MSKTYLAIDNGVSGSLGVCYPSGKWYFKKTPTFKEQSYTKKAQRIGRIDFNELMRLFNIVKKKSKNVLVVLERPLVNAQMFKATQSAMRSLEATLIAIEQVGFPFMYIDSKQWQKELLPKGLKGRDKLKEASLDIGKRLFPGSEDVMKKDCDGILICEFARRMKL